VAQLVHLPPARRTARQTSLNGCRACAECQQPCAGCQEPGELFKHHVRTSIPFSLMGGREADATLSGHDCGGFSCEEANHHFASCWTPSRGISGPGRCRRRSGSRVVRPAVLPECQQRLGSSRRRTAHEGCPLRLLRERGAACQPGLHLHLVLHREQGRALLGLRPSRKYPNAWLVAAERVPQIRVRVCRASVLLSEFIGDESRARSPVSEEVSGGEISSSRRSARSAQHARTDMISDKVHLMDRSMRGWPGSRRIASRRPMLVIMHACSLGMGQPCMIAGVDGSMSEWPGR
jgi:hypothetical protein